MAVIAELVRDRHRPLVMGILNVTPDSFYPGSRTPATKEAVSRAVEMVQEGADVLDVGGESTRPGAAPVPVEEEIDRVVPVVRAVTEELDVAVSVDTRRAEVARRALEAGASIVNDVSAARDDEAMLGVVADHGSDLVLMHMQGRPETMQEDPAYQDVVAEVAAFLLGRAEAAVAAGVPRRNIVLDPGIGFGKRLEHNLSLLRATDTLAGLGYALLVGASRKSMFGQLLDRQVDQRLPGSLAVAAYAALHGAAVLRVHDVAETVDVLGTLHAIEEGAG